MSLKAKKAKKVKTVAAQSKKLVVLKIFLILVILGVIGLFAAALMNNHIISNSKPYLYSMEDFEAYAESSGCHYEAAILLGCGVYKDGTPTPMLADRIRTAALVYKTGCVDYILVSGDSEKPEKYDEVGCMKSMLIELGVPEDDIKCDGLGLCTYDTMLRASTIFKVKSAVVVTTGFHLARSVYDSHKFGIESVGVEAVNSGYVIRQNNYYREFIARSKDFVFTLIKPGA